MPGGEPPPAALPPAVEKHVSVLVHAKVFTQDKPPEDFIPGSCWEAWIAILEQPGGARTFEKVFEHTEVTTAGKIYALCGLYFCDHGLFERKIEALRLAPVAGDVNFQRGDVFYQVPFSALVENTDPAIEHARLWYGESLSDYISRTRELRPVDVAGGGIPARLLDESWVGRAGTIDFAEYNELSVADGIELVRVRERFYKRWRRAIELNSKADPKKEGP